MTSEPLDFLPLLGPDIQIHILKLLNTQELVTLSRVSKNWKSFTESPELWKVLIERDFASTDAETFSAALHRGATFKAAYALLSKRNRCLRCKSDFKDGLNSSTSCNFHPGLLFSGGLINGEALRFTCCSRRAHQRVTGSRDSNGCKTSYHVGNDSIWAPQGSLGAVLRTNEDAGRNEGSTSSSSSAAVCAMAGGGSGRLHGPLEWHPHQRPGLIELPSRWLAMLSV